MNVITKLSEWRMMVKWRASDFTEKVWLNILMDSQVGKKKYRWETIQNGQLLSRKSVCVWGGADFRGSSCRTAAQAAILETCIRDWNK